MGGAHGYGIGSDSQRGAQCRNRDLKGGVALGVGGQILLAVHDHVIIIGAAPQDDSGHFSVRHGQGGRAFHGGTARAALQGHIHAVFTVRRGLGSFLSLGLCVADAHGVVIPLALGPEECQLEVLVHSGHGDIIAVDLLRSSIGVGDGVGGRQQPVCLVGLGIGGHANIQVDDLLGGQADVEGHLPVLHGQGAHAIAGFVGVEHAAVGVELSRVHAVRQGSFGAFGSGGSAHGRSGFRADSRGSSGRSPAAAGESSGQHQGSNGQGNELFAVHKQNTSKFRI